MLDPTAAGFRCHATLLFADLCDYTALAESSDPEEVAPILHQMREAVEAVVRMHGGTVNEWRGDGVLCIFGVPRATEEDPKRAIEAALDMHGAVHRLDRAPGIPADFRVRLHSGIDSGLVFARKRAGVDGYDLIGDAVNTAARLCAKAGRDEVWVSEPTLHGFRELFETETVEALALKGKKEPVPACRVLGRSDISTRFAASQRRGLTPLVGREKALETLLLGLAETEKTGLKLVTVVGSPGIGKTRTLDELKRQVPIKVRVLEGLCEGEPRGTLLQPFVDMLRAIFELSMQLDRSEAVGAFDSALRELDPTLMEVRDVLLRLLGLGSSDKPSSNPDAVMQSYVSALVQVFTALSRKSRLVLILDDWQWADDVSRQVLGELMKHLRESPHLVAVASRDLSDPLLSTGDVVELDPFTHEESARVIASILPYSLDLGLSRTIHERAGGNPLFLEELCRALPLEAPSGVDDLVGSKTPSTLRGIIQVRTERLPELPASVLRASAVIGGEVPTWLLARLIGECDLDTALRMLVQSDLIHPSNEQGAFRFKHWTTREVVYEAVRLPERKRLHELTAQELEQHAERTGLPQPFEMLAYHYAGSGNYARAAQFAEQAGDRAAAASSLDHARQQYRAALEALEKQGLSGELAARWIRVVEKWAGACLYSPSEDHLALIQRAGQLALGINDIVGAARAEYWLGWFSYALGNLALASKYCRAALERAQVARDERLLAQLFLNLGQSLGAAGEYKEALAHFATGLDSKRRGGRPNHDRPAKERRVPLGYAYALSCKGLIHGDLGEFPTAYACFEEALGQLTDTGHAVEGSCWGVRGMVELLQGNWAQALESATRAQAMAERVNGPYVFAMSKTVSGYARWKLERTESAIAELLHAVQWMESRGARLFISFNYAYLADALLAAGETARAAEYAGRALDRVAFLDHLGEAMAHRTLARIAQREGSSRPGEARAHLVAALESARIRDSSRELAMTELEIGAFHAARGERYEAERSLTEAKNAFIELGMPAYERIATERLAAVK